VPTISTPANRGEGVHFSRPTRLLTARSIFLPLDLASPHEGIIRGARESEGERGNLYKKWCAMRDLNPRPDDP
jgi:hypothetical protein